MMRSDTVSLDLNELDVPEFHRQKTYVERTHVCFNSCIGCLYIFFCMPCYFCYLNDKCNNQGN